MALQTDRSLIHRHIGLVGCMVVMTHDTGVLLHSGMEIVIMELLRVLDVAGEAEILTLSNGLHSHSLPEGLMTAQTLLIKEIWVAIRAK